MFLAGIIFVHFVYLNSCSKAEKNQRPHPKRASIDTLKKQQIALQINDETADLSTNRQTASD